MNSDLKNHGRLTAAGWLVVRLSPGILSRPAFFFGGSYAVVSLHSAFRCSGIQSVG